MLTLREWRRAKGFSFKKMAELLNIHSNTYIKWEKRPENITIENAYKIAGILEIDFNDIDFFCH